MIQVLMPKRIICLTLLLAVLAAITSASAAEPDVSALITALSGTDSEKSISAAQELGKLGPKARPALLALVQALGAQNPQLRAMAARSLGEIGPEAKSAVEALANRLVDDDPMVRAYAAFALGEIGEAAQSAAPALVKAVTDKNATVRRNALDALRRIDAPSEVTLPLMVKTLEGSDPAAVLPALQALAEAGEESLPRLRAALKHPQASYWACLVVREMGPKAKELTPDLIALLDHEYLETRMQALIALGAIGPDAKAAVPQILDMLNQERLGGIRYAAAFALGQIGAPEARQPLLDLFQNDSEDLHLRTICGWSLLQLEPDNQQLVDAVGTTLITALKSEDELIRSTAIRALADIAASKAQLSDDVRRSFAAALSDSDPEVVSQLVDALAAHGAKVVPAVMRGLKNPDLQPYAIEVIRRIGADAKPAVPALLQIWTAAADNFELRREVQFALGAIGPDAAAAVPQLIESLTAADPEVRYSACFALGSIGPAAEDALRPLAKQVTGKVDDFMPIAAAWAMVRIRPHDKNIEAHAVPLLTQALGSDRERVRVEAATTLGDIGEAAKTSLPALQEATQDKSPAVRAAAEEAIKKIG